jgi:acetyl-CoA carboxylase biotin carboxylase subunit
MEAVAVYSTADREGLWVRLADRAVCVGPHQPSESYLHVANLVAAAETTGCDAVHPGWGFLAESAAFVRACTDNDLIFVGPPAESMEAMGDKSRARTAMQAAGVPLVPGSTDRLNGADHARGVAAELGYPVLLKAVAGGGGRGMRLVDDPADIEDAYGLASSEALASFGDGGMYLEKAVVNPRHVEMQVLADGEGGVLVLGERDCSVQRRHQKLIEEGPSPALDPPTRAQMAEAATLACTGCGYRNAGTVEFLLDTDGRFYFIEMNTRLQVEHPVSELLTGVDLACQQLLLAGGGSLPGTGLAPLRGHAIEFRINCEDPSRDFRPAAGTVTALAPPLGPGVRLDTHAYPGYKVPPFYDSLLAKLIVKGSDRADAIERMIAALSAFRVEGVPTTIPMHLAIMRSEAFRSGRYDTRSIPGWP